ncbi:hypothetical protein E5D57_009886 [Metarhizium anisopliae]|nr:hypothetical protein E5D57_009886 [Metarhizium anisopliae]
MGYKDKEEEDIWRQSTHARLCSRRQQEALASTKGDAPATEKPLSQRSPSPRQMDKVRHGTPGSRITEAAPTHAKAWASGRRRRPTLDTVGKLGNSTRTASHRQKRQPKIYKKERSSRRQAGKAPEYGMLGEGFQHTSNKSLKSPVAKSRRGKGGWEGKVPRDFEVS